MNISEPFDLYGRTVLIQAAAVCWAGLWRVGLPRQEREWPSWDDERNLLWLVSPASSFVTSVVVLVDGGFASFSGV